MSIPSSPHAPPPTRRPSQAFHLHTNFDDLRRTASSTPSEDSATSSSPSVPRIRVKSIEKPTRSRTGSAFKFWPNKRSSVFGSLDEEGGIREEEVPTRGGDGDVELSEETEGSWYEVSRPRGKMSSLRRDHKFDGKDLVVWTGYGHASLDWDALFTFELLDRMPLRNELAPRRVLDVGCGVGAHWILHMVNQPGWEHTEFVGWDVAPIQIPPGSIPSEAESRIRFQQINVFQECSIEPGDYDLIRCSGCFEACPEHLYEPFHVMFGTVLDSGGALECYEPQFELFPFVRSRTNTDSTDYDPHLPIYEAFDSLMERRFLNLFPHSRIPASLSAGIATPSHPFPPTEINVADRSVQSRVWLHAYARKMDGAGGRMASEFATTQTDDPKRQVRLTQELEETISDWSQKLIDEAAVGRCLEEEWGWSCAMDEAMVERLENVVVPELEQRLRECDAWVAEDSREEQEIEVKRTQNLFARREARAELTAAMNRLGYDEDRKIWSGDVKGKIKFAGWRTVKRD